MKNLEEHKESWRIENEPVGQYFGYPACCIKEFCAQPPELMENKKPSGKDEMRFNAACFGDRHTGFIPCAEHGRLIVSGKITLNSLIKNRKSNKVFPFG